MRRSNGNFGPNTASLNKRVTTIVMRRVSTTTAAFQTISDFSIANLAGDFNSTRLVRPLTFTVQFSPTTTVLPNDQLSVQLFWADTATQLAIPATRTLQLSTTVPRQLTCVVPTWMTEWFQATATDLALSVRFYVPGAAATSTMATTLNVKTTWALCEDVPVVV